MSGGIRPKGSKSYAATRSPEAAEAYRQDHEAQQVIDIGDKNQCPKQCRTCGRTWCGHYNDGVDLPKNEMLPCKGEEWILKNGLCPKCGSKRMEHRFGHAGSMQPFHPVREYSFCLDCGHKANVGGGKE